MVVQEEIPLGTKYSLRISSKGKKGFSGNTFLRDIGNFDCQYFLFYRPNFEIFISIDYFNLDLSNHV